MEFRNERMCTLVRMSEILELMRLPRQVEVLNPVNGVRLAEVVVPTSISERVNGNREDASDAVCGLHLFKKNSIW